MYHQISFICFSAPEIHCDSSLSAPEIHCDPSLSAPEIHCDQSLSAPEIHCDPSLRQPIELRLQSTLYIEVDVLGYPIPSVAWKHADRALKETARLTLEDHNGWSYLKLKNVAAEDGGQYTVTAENTAGKDSAMFTVAVKGKGGTQIIQPHVVVL